MCVCVCVFVYYKVMWYRLNPMQEPIGSPGHWRVGSQMGACGFLQVCLVVWMFVCVYVAASMFLVLLAACSFLP